ncbi:uncharacterized protein V6R79_008147 [Siganus canaliculatus]
MPRRKKNGQSPARVPGGPPPGEGSLGHNTGYQPPQRYDGAMANHFLPSSPLSNTAKEEIVKSMQEMFSHLDHEVIDIVLSECDFKVEHAMDSLLELSVAAEVATTVPSKVSGFERTAAALLSPHQFSEPRPDLDSRPAQQQSSSPSSNLLTEELDLLVDQELETLTTQQDVKDERHSSQYSTYFPPPPFPQQVLPELLQSSLQSGSGGPSSGLVEHVSETSSPVKQLSTWEDKTAEEQQAVVDFSHLVAATPAERPKHPLDLGASGRPSAFQVYKKQDPTHTYSSKAGTMLPKDVVGGARSKVNMPPNWNLEAPVFSPSVQENQGPTFITPVAQTPPSWPRHVSPWLSQGPACQAPLKPSATIPESWAMPPPQSPNKFSRLRLEGKVLVLLRGAPGSGKSTLARALVEHNPGGVSLSTDDYFVRGGVYKFDPAVLGEAHVWNQKRAKEAFQRGAYPIIIDNTNMQGWEMRPYVALALKHGYKVLFREPDTWWKNKPRELERRTMHNVPVETIRRMLNTSDRFVTIQSIMGSQMPDFKQQLPLENSSTQPSEAPCPDLVGQPALTEASKNSHPQLFSSLPDVSSIGRSGQVGTVEDGNNKSTESLNFQPTDGLSENPGIPDGDDDLDLGELDSELDALRELNCLAVDQRIPDCIVESVMNEDHVGDEKPVAFSESIGQRVKRERQSRRTVSDLVKDTTQSDHTAQEEEAEQAEIGRSKNLDFVGDWPSESSLEQRPVRRRERQQEDEAVAKEANEKNTTEVRTGPSHTEFQKLLDLIQTGVIPVQSDSSSSSSFSPRCGEDLEKAENIAGECEASRGSTSDGEETEENMNMAESRRGELPDCVLDWKATNFSKVIESRNDERGEFQTENEACGGTAERDGLLKDQTIPLKGATADPLVIPKNEEVMDECQEGEEGEIATTSADNCTEDVRSPRLDAETSQMSEACQSPACDSSCEAESGGSQEKKQRQGRRSGKLSCKLALTFTQNCLNAPECPNMAAQSIQVNQDGSSNSDLNVNPNLTLEQSCDLLLIEFKSEPSSPHHLEVEGCSTQTEPQDFALLWRLNHQDAPDAAVVTAQSQTCDLKVLAGDSSCFVPESPSAASVHPSGHAEIPYRVVHEKGTQVEEKDVSTTQGRLESLRILSRHFKLVCFDTLEDLYDKCHQDLEWTTNLLLDSGERFFRDEKEEEEEDDSGGEDQNTSGLHRALVKPGETSLCPDVLEEPHAENLPREFQEVTQQSAFGTMNKSDADDEASHVQKSPQVELNLPPSVDEGEQCLDTEVKEASGADLEGGAWGGGFDDGVVIEDSSFETEEDIASREEVHRLLQAELDKIEREERQKEEERAERRRREGRRPQVDIQSVELKLPTEVALQLTELFGPVGVDPGSCCPDDCVVQMDLHLAKLLHQKWKETIKEKQRQESLSFHLLQESSIHWGESKTTKPGSSRSLISADGNSSVNSQTDIHSLMPFMDHWNVSRPPVSLRDIIKEEQALQENVKKARQSRADLDRRDGAALLKENQLYTLFPTIDRHFLQDIFRDYNYSLTQTELFLRSLLDEEPVKTVVAPEAPRSDHHRTASKERDKRQKPIDLSQYQDTEDPQYEDFRAEANLQRRRQLESFSKAAKAFEQGHKQVASFYAQQGHLHGKRMREANHRAAVQIFERVNSSLLPNNILDLHGLHVDEALQHLTQVLEEKTNDCEQGLCRPQLSVITGRGNHSQGGVARIRPAVIDYLTNKHYRFTEPQPGLVLVSLK